MDQNNDVNLNKSLNVKAERFTDQSKSSVELDSDRSVMSKEPDFIEIKVESVSKDIFHLNQEAPNIEHKDSI
jgi:hypothetical protein